MVRESLVLAVGLTKRIRKTYQMLDPTNKLKQELCNGNQMRQSLSLNLKTNIAQPAIQMQQVKL